jgi:hypothetical protein
MMVLKPQSSSIVANAPAAMPKDRKKMKMAFRMALPEPQQYYQLRQMETTAPPWP